MSYASALSAKSKPEDRLAALRDAYQGKSQKDILRQALGDGRVAIPIPAIAQPLIQHIIVICVDTESHTLNTDQMTELGLVHISRKTARAAAADGVGMHGQKLQEALRFLHFRIAEHAHLLSNREDSRGPLGNRFGHTRFTTFLELRTILQHLFNQPVDASDDPDLRGCRCPVVLVGHALQHDVDNAMKPGLDYDISSSATVVARVDTQALAREVEVWVPPPEMWTNEIGLRVLVERLGFVHVDDHTACNDAARTMMCAVHMVLPEKLRVGDMPSMQAVADRVELQSQTTSPAPYGTAMCCTRCGGRDHNADQCTAVVTCAACHRFDSSSDSVHTHIETYCLHVAAFKAWARRFRDAAKKHDKKVAAYPAAVRSGPGAAAHPWSTWPQHIRWPLEELRDVLVGMGQAKHQPEYHQPEPRAQNMQAALGGIPVPASGRWVLVDGSVVAASTGSLSSELSVVVDSSATAGRPWSSGLTTVSNSYSPPAPAPPPGGTREVRMSEMRGRGRGDRGGGGRSGGHGSGWKKPGEW